MHLTEDEIMKAAKIAASKFGSNDPAIDSDDLVSIAYLRIVKRDPWNSGTAVFVGREAIGRVIGQDKYRKQFERTCRGENVDTSERPPRGEQTTAERKKRQHARHMMRLLGPPLIRFGRFGVVYPESVAADLRAVFFDSIDDVGRTRRKLRLLLSAGSVTTAAMKLANSHYVLLLVPDGKSKKTNAAGVAGPKRKSAVQKARRCG